MQDKIIFIEELSTMIGKKETTIRTCATSKGCGHLIPPPFKLPGSLRLCWKLSDVTAWIAQATPVTAQIKRRRGAPTKAERLAREG